VLLQRAVERRLWSGVRRLCACTRGTQTRVAMRIAIIETDVRMRACLLQRNCSGALMVESEVRSPKSEVREHGSGWGRCQTGCQMSDVRGQTGAN
jgi:hypothetical protein